MSNNVCPIVCEGRSATCHITCKQYLDWREKHLKEIEAGKAVSMLNQYSIDKGRMIAKARKQKVPFSKVTNHG